MTRYEKFHGRHLPSALLILVAALALVLSLPLPALADDSYSIDQVDIDATVGTDGSVFVQETRTFDFDGSFHGVYWDIPRGDYEGRTIEPVIGQVGIVEDGAFVAFQESESGLDGTYEVRQRDNYVEVKIFSAHYDESASFQINYVDPDLATRYNDTAELYWKFVSDGWDVESQNVTCTFHLPVPAGANVQAGDNVLAWGHGPLDASLAFQGDDVVYTLPGVGTDEYAEARIAFPADWLSEAEVTDKNMLDSIVSEEDQWAQEADAKRQRARFVNGVATAVFLTAVVATLVVALVTWSAYRRSHKPQFDDTYFRDVPTKDHPSVLGLVYHGGNPESQDLTAAIMTLTDEHRASLEVVGADETGTKGRRAKKPEYVVRRLEGGTEPADRLAAKVDEATLGFLFDEVAPLTRRGDAQTLYLADIERAAKGHSEAYRDAYEEWKSCVHGAYLERGYEVDKGNYGSGRLVGMIVIDTILAVLSVVLIYFEVIGFGRGFLCLAALVAAIILGAVALGKMRDLSPEAVEVKARLEGLRRWLKDFTRLEEAVPQDMILWNKLLVMAVVLGVADEVIDQLRTVMPRMLESDQMMPVYGWYYYGGYYGMDSPLEAFNHTVSVAAAAASPDSSSGGGGGFSGGGGGGFGGGGGGGAF